MTSEDPFWTRFGELGQGLFAWLHLRIPSDLKAVLDPHDLFQEIGIRACTKFSERRGTEEEFEAWGFGIARNVLGESFCSFDRRPEAIGRLNLVTEEWNSVQDRATSFSQKIVRRDAFRTDLERVEALPEQDQRLIIHHGLEKMTMADTAEILGITLEAAKKRWQRVRSRLRELLEE